MVENTEILNDDKPVKRARGRPRIHKNGYRAYRDANRDTLISKKRLNELLEIERTYLEIKNKNTIV